MTPSFYDIGDSTPDAVTKSGRSQDILAQVRAYWEALREGNGIPLRSQLDPRGIESALSSAFLIERIAPGIARFRIAGMDLADLMGMELRGMPFSAAFCPASREKLASVLEQVFAKPAILTMALTAERGYSRPALSSRLLVLPMRSEQGDERLALGCFAIEGNIGRSPRRFEIDSHALMHLPQDTAAQLADWPRKGAFIPMAVRTDENRRTATFAEAAEHLTPRPQGSVPYLRLVKSDS